ncbi:hypothetical protein BX600DRAFT_483309 [Xylariales sp. PMI_506]|nr:hypothetical protein BX600DRAFT_483309 [Xylariales sp. PMI_506]
MSCPECFSGSVWASEPVGIEMDLCGVNTYVAGNPSQPPLHQSTSTIIFITDAFGFNLVNSKLVADTYAQSTGFRVLVPDIIPGGGVPANSLRLMNAIREPVAWWNIWGHLKRILTIARMMSIFIPFARRTRNVFPDILTYTRAVKGEVADGGKLGVAGFCWGALQTTKLSAEPAVDGGSEPLVNCHFMAHPAGLKPVDFVRYSKQFHVPLSLAMGDEDIIMSKEVIAEVEASLRPEYITDLSQLEVKLYKKCGHGFAVRADRWKTVEDEAVKVVTDQAVKWFIKFLT